MDTPTLPTPTIEPCQRAACQQARWHARQQASFYQTLHQRALQREAKRKAQLAQVRADTDTRLRQRASEFQQRLVALEAQVRLLKQRLYGRSCETHQTPNTLAHTPAPGDADPTTPAAPPTPRRRRGQQRGRPGPGRRH